MICFLLPFYAFLLEFSTMITRENKAFFFFFEARFDLYRSRAEKDFPRSVRSGVLGRLHWRSYFQGLQNFVECFKKKKHQRPQMVLCRGPKAGLHTPSQGSSTSPRNVTQPSAWEFSVCAGVGHLGCPQHSSEDEAPSRVRHLASPLESWPAWNNPFLLLVPLCPHSPPVSKPLGESVPARWGAPVRLNILE